MRQRIKLSLEHVESLTVARRLGQAAAHSQIRGINVLAKRPPPGQIKSIRQSPMATGEKR